MSEYKYKNLIPSQLDFIREPVLTSRVGNESIQQKVFNAESGVAPAVNATQNFNITSSSGVWSSSVPRLSAEVVANISYTRANAAADADAVFADIKNKFGMFSLPLNRCVETCIASFGNTKMTTNVADNVPVYLNTMDTKNLAAISPCGKSDTMSEYDATVLNDPLRAGSDTINSTETRGIGSGYDLVISALNHAGTNQTATLTIKLDEALMSKPFQFQDILNSQAFPNFNCRLELKYVSDFAKALFSAHADITVANASINQLKVVMKQYRPQANAFPKALPSKFYYNSNEIRYFPVQARPALNANADNALAINANTFQGMPSKFVLMVEKTRAGNEPEKSYALNAVDVNMGGKPKVLATYQDSANPQGLYHLATKNGYNQRYSEFAGLQMDAAIYGASSLVMWSPADVDLPEFVQENANVQVELDATFNVRPFEAVNAGDYKAGLYMVKEAIITYDSATNEWNEAQAWCSPKELADAGADYYTDESEASHAIEGGNIFKGLKKAFSKVKGSWMKLPQGLRRSIGKVSQTARNLPAVSEFVGDNTLLGKQAKKVGAGRRGGKVVSLGGKVMSNAELMRLIE